MSDFNLNCSIFKGGSKTVIIWRMVKIGLILGLLLILGILVFNIPGKAGLLNPKTTSFNLIKPQGSEVQLPKPALENIFLDKPSYSNLDENKIITVIATGDVIPARSVNYQVNQRKSFTWPF